MRNFIQSIVKRKQLLPFVVAMVAFAGCSDSRYTSERLFHQAEKGAARIFAKGRGNITESDHKKIIALYRKVADQAPLEPMAARAQFAIAGVYNSQGRYRESQTVLKEIIHNFSSVPNTAAQAQLAIGKLYEAQGKWEEAIEEYETLMDLYPLTNLGLSMPMYVMQHYQNVHDSDGEDRVYEKGVRHYEEQIKEFTETEVVPALRDYLANFHVAKGNYLEAIEVWNKLIKHTPATPQAARAYLAKGEVYIQKMRNASRAIEVYEEFVQRYPKYSQINDVTVRLGLLYVENKELDKAKNLFNQLIEKDPDAEDVAVKAYLGLSQAYRSEANTQKVIEVLKTISEKYPTSKAALSIPFLIAQHYEQMKFSSQASEAYKEAIGEYKEVLENDNMDEEAKREAANFLALCYIKKNDMEKALELLRMLAEKYPDNPMYLLDTATLYLNLNASGKAMRVYQEILEKFPRNKLIVRLVQERINKLQKKVLQ